MAFDFDTWMTVFWIGFAAISASMISRRESVIAVFIFWFILFPIIERDGRELLRAVFRRHPEDLCALVVAATIAYLIAASITAFRITRHARKTRKA